MSKGMDAMRRHSGSAAGSIRSYVYIESSDPERHFRGLDSFPCEISFRDGMQHFLAFFLNVANIDRIRKSYDVVFFSDEKCENTLIIAGVRYIDADSCTTVAEVVMCANRSISDYAKTFLIMVHPVIHETIITGNPRNMHDTGERKYWYQGFNEYDTSQIEICCGCEVDATVPILRHVLA